VEPGDEEEHPSGQPVERDEVALLASRLTPREREVLALLVGGSSPTMMAEALGTDRPTVGVLVRRILNELHERPLWRR
jgi:DNA-binding CsgD family transcriptional regulator